MKREVGRAMRRSRLRPVARQDSDWVKVRRRAELSLAVHLRSFTPLTVLLVVKEFSFRSAGPARSRDESLPFSQFRQLGHQPYVAIY